MELERLFVNTFDEHYQDFAKCEQEWQDVTEDKVKKAFHSSKEVLKLTQPDTDLSQLEWEAVQPELLKGRVVRSMHFLCRMKTTDKKCPICGSSFKEEDAAISRIDNKTMICSVCGQREAFDNLFQTRG